MKTPALLLVIILSTFNLFSQTPTEVTIRTLAKDAKFIGTGMGGLSVEIKDSETNEVISTGMIKGATGNTGMILADSIGRYQQKANSESAKFTTILNLSKPQKIAVTVKGPLSLAAKNQITVSEEFWVIPGINTSNEGFTLELDGFAVTANSPEKIDDNSYTLKMNTVMMCGCPITSGGFWNADKMEATAMIYRNGEIIEKVKMGPGVEKNTFTGTWKPKDKGLYIIYYTLYDPRNNNTGVDETSFSIN
ncbi:hypothetical protein [Marinigracilibium pacificum]|uniref:Uncharacterized protein n=1 Tax=Marinigracilibium pacificum TaxID=2729599 RepID=A0A848ISW0_9BACT|nr:hypothetical protein [Marinigracilibium pacificum]NMM46866.1 hypothetical protein [Marinigracilibium pacificum]